MLQNTREFGRSVAKEAKVTDLDTAQIFDMLVEKLKERYLQDLPEMLLSYGTRQPLQIEVLWRVRPQLSVRRQ